MSNSLLSGRSASSALHTGLLVSPSRRRLLLAGFTLMMAIISFLALYAEPRMVSDALVAIEEASLGPSLAAVDEATVQLPHRCYPDPATWVCSITYQLQYHHDRERGEVALYLPHFGGKARVSLNGSLIAASRLVRSPISIGESGPVLVQLPDRLLEPGPNELAIEVYSEQLFGGHLGRVYIGPDEDIRPHYTFTRFVLVTLPRLIDGWILAMGAFLLLIRFRRPNEQAFFVFGVILLLFAASSLPAIWPEMDDNLARLANISRLAGASLLLPFSCYFVDRSPPVPIALFLLLPITAVICVFVLPGELGGWILRYLVVPLILIQGLAVIPVLVAAAFSRGGSEPLLLLGSAVVVAVFAIHDLLVLNSLLDSNRVLLSRFNMPLLMLVVGALLVWRMATALALTERYNARLKAAVVAAEAKLREQFSQRQAEARRAALEAERMRLIRDLHDGLGGQLVSILSLSETGKGEESKEIVKACQRALTDLRLMLNSLEDVGNDLSLMLGMFRERIEPQLRAARIALDWRLSPLPEVTGLTPSVTLTIFRILQEAVTNVMRHSGCTRVAIVAQPLLQDGYAVRLIVRDNGHGGAARRPGSRGLLNMEERSAAINARFTIESAEEGTSVLIDLPSSIPPSSS